MTVFCGVTYPIAVMPQWMQVISRSLPLTHSIHSIRFVAAGGNQAGLAMEVRYLLISGGLLLLAGYVIYVLVERHMLHSGTVGQYLEGHEMERASGIRHYAMAIWAIFRKDVQVFLSYPLNAIMRLVEPIMWITPIYFMSRCFQVGGVNIGLRAYTGTSDYIWGGRPLALL